MDNSSVDSQKQICSLSSRALHSQQTQSTSYSISKTRKRRATENESGILAVTGEDWCCAVQSYAPWEEHQLSLPVSHLY